MRYAGMQVINSDNTGLREKLKVSLPVATSAINVGCTEVRFFVIIAAKHRRKKSERAREDEGVCYGPFVT